MKNLFLIGLFFTLTGCGQAIDERVDVSSIGDDIDKEGVASCALVHGMKIVEERSKKNQPTELVSIELTNAKKINKDLNVIGFSVDLYNQRTGRVSSVSFDDFGCYASQEALDKAKNERIRLAKEEAERNHQKNLELEKKRAEEAIERQINLEAERKRQAELKMIRDKAEKERKAIHDKAEKERKEAIDIERIKSENKIKKMKLEEAKEISRLKKKHSAFSKECVLSDSDRVINSLLKSLPSIHRPGAFHVENQEITSIQFYKEYISVAYRFKLYEQTSWRRGAGYVLGEKGIRQHSMKDTDGIHVVPFGWSTAKAKCLLKK